MATWAEHRQAIIRKYIEDGGRVPFEMAEVADWAMSNRLWFPRPSDLRQLCAEELSRAAREEYYTDSRGRKVRTKHVARHKEGSKQTNLWDDIRTAPRSHMVNAFGLRRRQIVGDCQQLKTDADSYNDGHPEQAVIQVSFDFSRDVRDVGRAA